MDVAQPINPWVLDGLVVDLVVERGKSELPLEHERQAVGVERPTRSVYTQVDFRLGICLKDISKGVADSAIEGRSVRNGPPIVERTGDHRQVPCIVECEDSQCMREHLVRRHERGNDHLAMQRDYHNAAQITYRLVEARPLLCIDPPSLWQRLPEDEPPIRSKPLTFRPNQRLYSSPAFLVSTGAFLLPFDEVDHPSAG